MGSSQRLAAVAAVHHARHYYNRTQPAVQQAEHVNLNVNVFFVSATICGVLVAVCASCWRRSSSHDKPDDVAECRGVYTVSNDSRLNNQSQVEMSGPPPAYDTVVNDAPAPDQKHDAQLQEVTSGPCERCTQVRCDSGLPSYEAAVMLKDTRL